MARPIAELELQAIEAVVPAHPEGIAIRRIQDALEVKTARRTHQYRLKHLVDEVRLIREGKRRWAKCLMTRRDRPPRHHPLNTKRDNTRLGQNGFNPPLKSGRILPTLAEF